MCKHLIERVGDESALSKAMELLRELENLPSVGPVALLQGEAQLAKYALLWRSAPSRFSSSALSIYSADETVVQKWLRVTAPPDESATDVILAKIATKAESYFQDAVDVLGVENQGASIHARIALAQASLLKVMDTKVATRDPNAAVVGNNVSILRNELWRDMLTECKLGEIERWAKAKAKEEERLAKAIAREVAIANGEAVEGGEEEEEEEEEEEGGKRRVCGR